MIRKINIKIQLFVPPEINKKQLPLNKNLNAILYQPLIYNKKYLFTTINDKKKIFQQIQQIDVSGTQYTNWILTRSQSHNHDIAHLKRKHLKDRFSIHKLTNIKFLCALANHRTQYTLNTNEKIILLAQLNHVFNIIGKSKQFYNQFSTLSIEVIQQLKDPHDLICIGTFLSTLTNLGNFSFHIWQSVMDSLVVKKSDQQYDQIFGIISSLAKYKIQILQMSQYNQAKDNMILQFIPVIYRNNLQLLRQFIKYNIYNLKECRILLRCLYENKIKQKHFWLSVNDWFNIFVKEQISRKNFDEFFIINQKAIEKVINDDGMIRPRPILQQLTQIAYIISSNIIDENGMINQRNKYPLRRFLQFVEDIILYSIQNGSKLYQEYLSHYQHQILKQKYKQQQYKSQQTANSSSNQQQITINEQFQTTKQQQKERIKLMERQYRNIFVNPIQIKNQTIVQLVVVMRRCCGYDIEGNVYQPEKSQNRHNQQSNSNQQLNEQSQQHKQKQKQEGQRQKLKQQYNFIRPQQLIEINVLKWLVMRLCKSEMNYTISQLLQIIESQNFFAFSNINLDQLILSKLKSLRNIEVNLKDLKKLMLFLPVDYFQQLQPIIINFLYKSHPSDIYQLTRIIEMQSISLGDQQYSFQFPRKQQKQKWLPHLVFYFMNLPQIVNIHYKYYSFQQNCYFLYYLLKSQVYWQNKMYQSGNGYLGQMEKLKECVKITSYSRGFKLQMNSYFYKLLNYVDLVQFFQGGNG